MMSKSLVLRSLIIVAAAGLLFSFNGCALYNWITGKKTGEPLVNTRWVVKTVHGNDIKYTGNETWFVIQNENGQLGMNGRSECNQFFVQVSAKDESFSCGDPARTKMNCDNIKIEDMFLIALTEATKYEIDGKVLRFFNKDKKELIKCEAVFL